MPYVEFWITSGVFGYAAHFVKEQMVTVQIVLCKTGEMQGMNKHAMFLTLMSTVCLARAISFDKLYPKEKWQSIYVFKKLLM